MTACPILQRGSRSEFVTWVRFSNRHETLVGLLLDWLVVQREDVFLSDQVVVPVDLAGVRHRAANGEEIGTAVTAEFTTPGSKSRHFERHVRMML